jgi:hypothetical protein
MDLLKSDRSLPLSELRGQDIKSHAHAYRLAVAQKIIDLFEEANGRPANTVEELTQWCASDAGKAATADHRDADGKIIP